MINCDKLNYVNLKWGSEFSSYEIELRNRVTEDDELLTQFEKYLNSFRVTNSIVNILLFCFRVTNSMGELLFSHVRVTNMKLINEKVP